MSPARKMNNKRSYNAMNTDTNGRETNGSELHNIIENIDSSAKKEGKTNNSDSCELLNMTNEISLSENGFLPEDILMEEKRLKEEHLQEGKKIKVNNLDEAEKSKRFESLHTLLINSTKLTNIFEFRLKKCKSQIINTEMGHAVENGENVNISNSNEPVNQELNEESYLSLFKQPKLFCGDLKKHQIEGLLWIRTLYENGLNGILADEMGLGKTIQTIAFYCFLIEKGIKGPFLVIVPMSTIPNWISEFAKFSPKLPTLLYHGSEQERINLQSKFKKLHKVIDNLSCFPIIVTTYEIVRVDINFLKKFQWVYITIDEGHKLKNSGTILSQAMRQFNCANKLLLTGTPIQNDMTELWSLLNLLMPKLFNKLEDFNSWFVIDNFLHSNQKIASMAKENEILDIIHKVIKPFILRREKTETDIKLPPKKEIVIYAPLTKTQQELYKATLDKHLEILLNQKETSCVINGIRPKRKCVEQIERYTDHNAIMTAPEVHETKSKTMAISVIMQNPFVQLKKIANHPYLVHMPLIPGKQQILVDENIIKVSGKLQVLDAMLTKLKLLGHKILLFSTSTQLLDVVEEFVIFRNYMYTRLDGSMKIQDRIDAMKLFNDDPNCFLMLLSTRAGGLGLNLTSADTVIIYDSDWNPQADLQAQDRCHRMGQVRPVVVYRLCSKNTVDEKILECAIAKRKLEKIILGTGSLNSSKKSTSTTAVTIEELVELLNSSEYTKKIQSNGFIFTDEELDSLLDRSDMVDVNDVNKDDKSTSKTNASQATTTNHFKVVTIS